MLLPGNTDVSPDNVSKPSARSSYSLLGAVCSLTRGCYRYILSAHSKVDDVEDLEDWEDGLGTLV